MDLAKRFQRIASLKDPSLAFTDLAAEFKDAVGNPTRTALESVPYLLAILERPEQLPHTSDALHMLAGAARLDENIQKKVDAARAIYRRWAKQGSPEVRAAAQRLLPQKPVSNTQRLKMSTSFSDACECALAVLREVTNDTRKWSRSGSVRSVARLNGRILEYGYWMETNPRAPNILTAMAELEWQFEREKPALDRGLELGEKLYQLQRELQAYPPEATIRERYQFVVPRGAKPKWPRPLSPAQTKALRALARCDAVWTGDTNLWAAFGLPSQRDKLLELLHSAA